ncbi:hypothetical protein YC2023_078873 [Brassica napus]
MKSLMPSLKLPRLCTELLTILLHGDDELLITDMPKEEVESLFDSYEDSDFSRIESTAVEKVELKRGLLEQFTHEMESLLGKQGMPVRLNKGFRWIPANNLFAITVSVIDQNPAQKNVYQDQGVSFPDSC